MVIPEFLVANNNYQRPSIKVEAQKILIKVLLINLGKVSA